jgi:hypothetical protein
MVLKVLVVQRWKVPEVQVPTVRRKRDSAPLALHPQHRWHQHPRHPRH